VASSLPISLRVNAERIVLAGWTRAILLQVAHPLIAAAVAGHSSFRDNPVSSARRLHHTVRAMLGLTFGDAAAHARVINEIRAIHRRVHGVLREPVGTFPAGTAYSAEDPALVLWVHATLLESVIIAYEALVEPVAPGDRDAYCREASTVALELGARAGDVPLEWASLERYLASVHRSGAIAVGSDARAIAGVLLGGRFSMLLGPAAWANRVVTAGWLPSGLRAPYGLEWNDSRARQFTRTIAVLRKVRRLLPGVIALWPEARKSEAGSQT
jgi:uncharacterized protein (DUF2236 family)